MSDFDVITAAEEVVASTEGTFFPWSDQFSADWALTGYTYIAIIVGPHPTYKFERRFTPRTWPIKYDRKVDAAMDLGQVSVGDFLELSWNSSRRRTEREIVRVTYIGDDGIRWAEASSKEVKAHLKALERGV